MQAFLLGGIISCTLACVFECKRASVQAFLRAYVCLNEECLGVGILACKQAGVQACLRTVVLACKCGLVLACRRT